MAVRNANIMAARGMSRANTNDAMLRPCSCRRRHTNSELLMETFTLGSLLNYFQSLGPRGMDKMV